MSWGHFWQSFKVYSQKSSLKVIYMKKFRKNNLVQFYYYKKNIFRNLYSYFWKINITNKKNTKEETEEKNNLPVHDNINLLSTFKKCLWNLILRWTIRGCGIPGCSIVSEIRIIWYNTSRDNPFWSSKQKKEEASYNQEHIFIESEYL